jgi:hypothetical protein
MVGLPGRQHQVWGRAHTPRCHSFQSSSSERGRASSARPLPLCLICLF